MSWEGAEPLLAKLERWRPAGWVEHEGGGLQVCHVPDEGALAYLHTLYPGLSEDRLALTEAAYDRQLPAEYRCFLGWANGAGFFRHLRLNGSHIRGTDREPIDRSGVGVGQTISLDYGNQFGWPAGAPYTAWVLGTASGWSGQGYLLLRQDGGVTLCSMTDATDVSASWDSFSDMLFSEFDRMAALVGDRGERLAPHEHFLPEPARRWEKPKVRKPGLRNLFRTPK
ncbi:SMI1/KNR4 family protein [Brevundimonas sp.]|uniref:SMI1/KNR4 family protein n=1 Tax=Brevundimonas sp. TaxID=1871086 RepID=UPI00273783A5|nr:SMI1/KNR4 family protein [Brevundimonas sp.]MDP3800743.1 SMI1/KNR4 family protein [Brevundimonas sp.]